MDCAPRVSRVRLAIACLLVAVASAVLVPSRVVAQAQIPAWMRWEQTLTSTKTYSNAYSNLLLRVSWTCLTNCATAQTYWVSRLPVYGFWDGGRTFKLRAAFPQPLNPAANATWRWTTSCTTTSGSGDQDCSTGESGLNTTGTVTVTPSDGAHGVTNRLYTGGMLRLGEWSVVESGQLIRGNAYLITDNGAFYWQGDTAWAASMRASYATAAVSNPCTAANWSANAWKCYVQDRVGKLFTAIHLAVPQYWMNNPFQDTNGQAPFTAGMQWSQWNPAFWRTFEEKIEHANQQGLVVFLVGMMEPSYQYLQDPVSDAQRYPPLDVARTFARNLAVRLAGNFVIFSPGFDTPPTNATRINQIRGVGAEIDGVSLRQLITNHFGGQTAVSGVAGSFNDYLDYEAEPWLDAFLFQSGQARTLRSDTDANPQLQQLTQRARTMPLELRTFPLRKASANAETLYDYQGVALEDPSKNPAWLTNYTRYRVRQAGYLTTLSGAFGYSLGVYGLSDWGLGDGPVLTTNGVTSGPLVARSPQSAVTAASANETRFLGDLFRRQHWERFAPALLVRNNPLPEASNQHRQMVASRDITRRSTLAYLPDNQTIRLQLSAALYPSFTSVRWTKRFFDPRLGGYDSRTVTPRSVAGTTDQYDIDRPTCTGGGQGGSCDWVLELTDTNIAAVAKTLDGQGLQVWTAWDPEADAWSIVGQLVDAAGEAISGEIQISEPTPSMQRLPLVARGADGGYLVVWEAEDLDGDRSGVFGRMVSDKGEPSKPPFQVNEKGDGRQFEPVVTADAAGQYVVAWTSYSLVDETVQIMFRRYSAAGDDMGPESGADGGEPGVNRRSPLISADATGNFVVGWQEYAPAAAEWSIVTQNFDAAGKPSGGRRIVEASTSEYLALERLEMDGLGNFEVIWQRVLEAQSQGHFSRTSNRATESLSSPVLVAGGDE